MNLTRCSALGLAVVAAILALSGGLPATPRVHALQQQVSIGSATLAVGVQGTVQLEAHAIGAPGLGAWQIDITYNPAAGSAVSCTPLQQTAVCNATFAQGTIRLAGANATGLQGDFPLASVVFQCNSNAISNLTLNVQRFADTGSTDIPVSIQNGSITCGTPIRAGDVNCDGVVNSVDASLILQFTAGIVGSLPCQAAGDVNRDGSITPVDAALILQLDAGLIHNFSS